MRIIKVRRSCSSRLLANSKNEWCGQIPNWGKVAKRCPFNSVYLPNSIDFSSRHGTWKQHLGPLGGNLALLNLEASVSPNQKPFTTVLCSSAEFPCGRSTAFGVQWPGYQPLTCYGLAVCLVQVLSPPEPVSATVKWGPSRLVLTTQTWSVIALGSRILPWLTPTRKKWATYVIAFKRPHFSLVFSPLL